MNKPLTTTWIKGRGANYFLIFISIFLFTSNQLATAGGSSCPGIDGSNGCASSTGIGGMNSNTVADNASPFSFGNNPVQPQPNYFDAEQGAGDCSINGWENETSTATNECGTGPTLDGDCLIFEDNNACDQMIWTMPVTLDNPFCANFTMQTEGPGTDDAGFAFTMFSAEGYDTDDEPCQLQINSCGSGQSNGAGTAVDGNLGYSPTWQTAYVPGGALTVEFDIDNNSGDGLGSDDDFTGCNDHVSINEDGCIQENLIGECANFNDGNCHDVQICWDPNSGTGGDGLFTVEIDGVLITGLDEDITSYFNPHDPPQVIGSSGYEVYIAFTAGFQGNFGDNDGSQSFICDFYMDYTVPVPQAAPAGTGPAESANCLSLLPVELVEFEGELINDREVQLEWKTVSEVDNSHFEVLRSYDYKEWEKIGEVDGMINSNVVHYYRALDETFDKSSKTVYYQLEQVDLNGDRHKSNAISIDLEGSFNDLAVYPNPSNDIFHVKYAASESDELELISTDGKQISGDYVVERLSTTHWVIKGEQLKTGTYIVRVAGKHKKIIKN